MLFRKTDRRPQYRPGQLVTTRGPDKGNRYILLDFVRFRPSVIVLGDGDKVQVTAEDWTAQTEEGGKPFVLNTASVRPVKVVK